MGYPQYFVTFKGALVDGTGVASDGEVTVEGTHAFRLTAKGGEIQVSMEHSDEAEDRVPNLIITFVSN